MGGGNRNSRLHTEFLETGRPAPADWAQIQKKAGGGYPYLVFMVDVKVSYGDNILAGHFYLINTKYLKFKVLKNKNFKMSDFLDAYGQDLQRALCTTGGQLTTGAPKYNGVYTGGAF